MTFFVGMIHVRAEESAKFEDEIEQAKTLSSLLAERMRRRDVLQKELSAAIEVKKKMDRCKAKLAEFDAQVVELRKGQMASSARTSTTTLESSNGSPRNEDNLGVPGARASASAMAAPRSTSHDTLASTDSAQDIMFIKGRKHLQVQSLEKLKKETAYRSVVQMEQLKQDVDHLSDWQNRMAEILSPFMAVDESGKSSCTGVCPLCHKLASKVFSCEQCHGWFCAECHQESVRCPMCNVNFAISSAKRNSALERHLRIGRRLV